MTEILTTTTNGQAIDPDFYTWNNPAWVNREQVWSHRSQCWVWREFKKVIPAKSAHLEVEIPTEDIDLGISPEEVEEALAY